MPLRVHTIVISVQHSEEVSIEELRQDLMDHVVRAVVPEQYLDAQTVYHLQPSGKFVIGGPQVINLNLPSLLYAYPFGHCNHSHCA